jgi:hypothetical protein
MLDDLPNGMPRSSMGREELLRKLTGMAAEVVANGHVELGLGWLICNKSGDPVPRVPSNLLEVLMFVRDQGWQEVDAGYRGWDYFEDCLLLALRKSQTIGETRTSGGADLVAWAPRNQTAAQGT